MYLSDSRYEDYNHNATENIQGHSQTEHVPIYTYTRERRSDTKNKFSDVKAQKVRLSWHTKTRNAI